jgi:hypothetical protein
MNEQLSNCCKSQANVDSADEGTSCYVCAQCKRPCDLLQTGEQVSVDNLQISEGGEIFYNIPHDEYIRLKRLDENVKKKIVELNYRKMAETNQLWFDNIIKLLESLDK